MGTIVVNRLEVEVEMARGAVDRCLSCVLHEQSVSTSSLPGRLQPHWLVRHVILYLCYLLAEYYHMHGNHTSPSKDIFDILLVTQATSSCDARVFISAMQLNMTLPQSD